jgi:hypothetical protein
MQLNSYWHRHLAEMGNQPGEQQGDVTIYLTGAVAGKRSLTVPSASVSAAAENGSFIGLLVTLEGGRRLFVPAGSVVAVADAGD